MIIMLLNLINSRVNVVFLIQSFLINIFNFQSFRFESHFFTCCYQSFVRFLFISLFFAFRTMLSFLLTRKKSVFCHFRFNFLTYFIIARYSKFMNDLNLKHILLIEVIFLIILKNVVINSFT